MARGWLASDPSFQDLADAIIVRIRQIGKTIDQKTANPTEE